MMNIKGCVKNSFRRFDKTLYPRLYLEFNYFIFFRRETRATGQQSSKVEFVTKSMNFSGRAARGPRKKNAKSFVMHFLEHKNEMCRRAKSVFNYIPVATPDYATSNMCIGKISFVFRRLSDTLNVTLI